MSVLVPESLDNLVSTAEAAEHCGVAQETIRSWKARGHLKPSDLDNRGRPLYKLIDVLRAARDCRDRSGCGRQRIA